MQSVDADGFTLLHIACMYRTRPSVIKNLIDRFPASLVMQERYGNTPLHIACRHGAFVSVIDLLLNSCPEAANMTNKAGDTPLHRCFHSCTSTQTVKLLMLHGPEAVSVTNNSGATPLHCACAKAMHLTNPGIVKILIQGSVSRIDLLTRCDHKGNTPLHLGCGYGSSPAVVRLLLDAAGQQASKLIQLRNDFGETPLHVACKSYTELDIIQQLVSCLRSDDDEKLRQYLAITNHMQQTPLHLACMNSAAWNVLKFLIAAGPPFIIGMVDQNSCTPLHALVGRMRYERLESTSHDFPRPIASSLRTILASRSNIGKAVVDQHKSGGRSDDGSHPTAAVVDDAPAAVVINATTSERWADLVCQLAHSWPAACLVANDHSHLPFQMVGAERLKDISEQAFRALQQAASYRTSNLPVSMACEVMESPDLVTVSHSLGRNTEWQSILTEERYQTFLCGMVRLQQATTDTRDCVLERNCPASHVNVLTQVIDNVNCLLMHLLEHPTLCQIA